MTFFKSGRHGLTEAMLFEYRLCYEGAVELKAPNLKPLLSRFEVDCDGARFIKAELLNMSVEHDQPQRIRCVSADLTSINGGRATILTRVHQETLDDN